MYGLYLKLFVNLFAETININVLKHNTHGNIRETPGLLEAHERFILGKHYEQVRQWELEDNAFLGELQKTGKIKNGGEDGRVDE